MATATQLFRDFSTQVLREHKNDKKAYDYCVDAYSKTQLFDLSNIKHDILESEKIESYMALDNAGFFNNIMAIDILNCDFNIPFSSCFIKYNEYKTYFMNEFKPNEIHGAMVEVTDKHYLRISFMILNDGQKSTFTARFDGDLSEDYTYQEKIDITQLMLNNIIGINIVFKKISQKTVLLDKPIINKPTYYRYKDKSKGTLKVNTKPIYIVLDKKRTLKQCIYEKVDRQGIIERNFAFPVIGHWRKLDAEFKIGKDRNGYYTINGFTWVKSHIRGDKDSPIVQRERIIINGGKHGK